MVRGHNIHDPTLGMVRTMENFSTADEEKESSGIEVLFEPLNDTS